MFYHALTFARFQGGCLISTPLGWVFKHLRRYSGENLKRFQPSALILWKIYHAYYIFVFRKNYRYKNVAAQKIDFRYILANQTHKIMYF